MTAALVFSLTLALPFKTRETVAAVEKWQGRSRFENGIDQNTQPVCLNQVGGVAEPDQQVLFRIEMPG